MTMIAGTLDGATVYHVESSHVGVTRKDLVLVGETITTLEDWAQAVGLNSSEAIRVRRRKGITILDILMPEPLVRKPPPAGFDVDAAIARHPGGMSFVQIARYLDLTPQWVEKIYEDALEKIRKDPRLKN